MLDNLMIIKNDNSITIYDINTFQIIPNNTFQNSFINYNLYSLDNKCAFSIFDYKGKNSLYIYEIKENNIINNSIIELGILHKLYDINSKDAIYFNKVVFPLRDQKFIIKNFDGVYLFQIILN